QYAPIPVEEQIIAIFAGTHGFVDEIPVDRVLDYERDLVSWMRSERTELLAQIVEKKKLDDTLKQELKTALESFAKIFGTGNSAKAIGS
ncbi:MAG: hypothetical protein AAF550_10390, partial [Myxococcota bacterium]